MVGWNKDDGVPLEGILSTLEHEIVRVNWRVTIPTEEGNADVGGSEAAIIHQGQVLSLGIGQMGTKKGTFYLIPSNTVYEVGVPFHPSTPPLPHYREGVDRLKAGQLVPIEFHRSFRGNNPYADMMRQAIERMDAQSPHE